MTQHSHTLHGAPNQCSKLRVKEDVKMRLKNDKVILSWNECDLLDEEVEFQKSLLEEGETISDAELRSSILDNSNQFFAEQWDSFCESVGYKMLAKSKDDYCYHIYAFNMLWDGRSAEKFINLSDYASKSPLKFGEQVLKSILPNTNEFTIQVFNWNYYKGLHFNVKHHDNPVGGDNYYITPCARSKWEKSR